MKRIFSKRNHFLEACLLTATLIVLSCADDSTSVDLEDKGKAEGTKISDVPDPTESSDQTKTSAGKPENGCEPEVEGSSCETSVEILVSKCGDLDLKSANPETIQGFIDFVNDLPKPVSVNCVVEALERPLTITATSNRFSAQGATGSTSPRIFIEKGRLIMSFVPGGPERFNIELAETTTSDQSIKGDLKFPISEDLLEQSAFISIFGGGDPACANLCHTRYKKLETYSDGSVKYSSNRIFPKENSIVLLIEMELFRDDCESIGSSICNFYRSLFDHGEVNKFVFPAPSDDGGLPF